MSTFTSIIAFDPEYINDEQTYEVYIYRNKICEKQIFTTVTCIRENVDEWISDAESDSKVYTYRLIVGLEIKFTASGRVALVVLCICRSCLVFEISFAMSLPLSLQQFLSSHDVTFVGVDLRAKFEQLGKEYHWEGSRFHDLSKLTAERYNRPDLSDVGISQLRTFFYGVDLHRPEVVQDDWDMVDLSSDHVHHATIDAFVSYEIGSFIVYPTGRGQDDG